MQYVTGLWVKQCKVGHQLDQGLFITHSVNSVCKC